MEARDLATPYCPHCKHYYVTWDEKQPKGCRAHQFKSADFPHQIVYRTSGIPCQLYDLKERLRSLEED